MNSGSLAQILKMDCMPGFRKPDFDTWIVRPDKLFVYVAPYYMGDVKSPPKHGGFDVLV
jgi:hypothetical protein